MLLPTSSKKVLLAVGAGRGQSAERGFSPHASGPAHTVSSMFLYHEHNM